VCSELGLAFEDAKAVRSTIEQLTQRNSALALEIERLAGRSGKHRLVFALRSQARVHAQCEADANAVRVELERELGLRRALIEPDVTFDLVIRSRFHSFVHTLYNIIRSKPISPVADAKSTI
jgi:uncharacterized protein YceH (UPF0502 family)